MRERRIVQIVPFRSSVPDGVGDYALRIAEGMRDRHEVNTVFVAGTPDGVRPPPSDGWPTNAVAARNPSSLFDALMQWTGDGGCSAVLLHLSGYGYAKRGAPIWLLDGLRRWRRRATDVRLVVIFHELYARGRPWNSSFWLGPLQKHIAREIWKLADCALTTNSLYRTELARWRPDAADRIALMPVFSNVGEPKEIPPPCDRAPKAVVFGSAGIEKLLYEKHLGDMTESVRKFGIREIIDIGARRDAVPAAIGDASVTCVGRRSAEWISRRLLDCRLGFMSYDFARLGKSTIFAAYAAHGVVPICYGSLASTEDGLRSGKTFLHPSLESLTANSLSFIQDDLTKWYHAHSRARLVDVVAAMCS